MTDTDILTGWRRLSRYDPIPTLNIDKGINIPESGISTIRRHTQQTKTSTVAARPAIEQPANRPPMTENRQRDQPGILSLLTWPITEFHSKQNQLLHYDLCDQSQCSPQNSAQQNDQSQISKVTSKAISKAYMNSTHKNWPITL